MVRHDRVAERLTGLFVLGIVLLLPPVLLVFNRPERVAGIPVLYLYLFVAWALLIGLAAAIIRRIDRQDDAPAAGGRPDA